MGTNKNCKMEDIIQKDDYATVKENLSSSAECSDEASVKFQTTTLIDKQSELMEEKKEILKSYEPKEDKKSLHITDGKSFKSSKKSTDWKDRVITTLTPEA